MTSALSLSVLDKRILQEKRGDRRPALKVIHENGQGQLGHLQCELVLTDKVKV